MKNARKLIPALAMLLVSAILMTTASYAWFSMNTTVTATGMTVNAKADGVYLIINEGGTFNSAGTAKDVTSTHAATSLKPVAPVTAIVNGAAANPGAAAFWHYAFSNDAATSTKSGDYTVVTDAKLSDYVVSETFSIGFKADPDPTNTKTRLWLKSVDLPENTGISVVVVCNGKAYGYTADFTTGADLGVTASTTGEVITVYYYINGEDAKVYSNNMAALTGQVNLAFEVKEPA